MKRRGQARWNSETQRWEEGAPEPVRSYTGPMPPRPTFAPEPGPFPGPYGGGGGGGGTRRRTAALVAAGAVAVIAASAYGGYLLFHRGDGDSPPAARPPVSATQTPATADTTSQPSTAPSAGSSSPASASPSPSPSLPAGYHLVHDAKGFTIAVPDGWERSERPGGVFYTTPDERGLVQIFEITEPDISPEEALRTASKGLSGNPGYQEVSLGPMTGGAPGTDAAQLVYAYDSKRLGVRVKAVDCAFTVADGRQFAVLVLGPEADWPQQERIQRIALQAFAPGN